MINLFLDNSYIFKQAHFLIVLSHVQHFCTNGSFLVQAAYFKLWTKFITVIEAQQAIIQFVFAEFATLQAYLQQKVKYVRCIKGDVDRQR